MNYKKEVLTKIKTIMKLTREDFEGLEVNTPISNEHGDLLFNNIEGNIVFYIEDGNAYLMSIEQLNRLNYTIQKPKQYYQGWEVGDYTGKNVWVKVSDDSIESASIRNACLLKKIIEDGFILESDYSYKYAVQLTEVNTQNQCNTQ